MEFKTETEAKKVVEDLNGITFMGQKMEISLESNNTGKGGEKTV